MSDASAFSPRKPPWLRRRLPAGRADARVRELLRQAELRTVCEDAGCPNLWECFSKQAAAFLILGSRCSRRCAFCNIETGAAAPPDAGEAARLVAAAKMLGLRHIVITSVTRDDLRDGGAGHFAEVIHAIRQGIREARIEVLIPDFQGDEGALRMLLEARPDVVNHNIETPPRLYPQIRPGADYARSLSLLRRAREIAPGIPTKSGLMLGLGETEAEVWGVLRDLREAGCGMLTLGQYLAPSSRHAAVARYVPPEAFEAFRRGALDMGFDAVAAGPLVRSSYRADEVYERARSVSAG